jgi:glycosidase
MTTTENSVEAATVINNTVINNTVINNTVINNTVINNTVINNTVMDDFVFGGIEADSVQILAAERQRYTALRHHYDLSPRDPLPDEAVTITVFSGPTLNIDRATAYVTTDGQLPTGQRGQATTGFAVDLVVTAVRWEPLLWDYVTVWHGTLPPQPAGIFVQYVIEGWRSYDEHYACWSNEFHIDGTVSQVTRYGYFVDRFATPAWAQEAVVYHIFVDRFTGIENRWLDATEMNAFTGGTLRGVIDKLDYIADLGVTAIWLSPVFVTPSYHGYDTTDYYQVDARFGSNADLRELIDAAHARNLRVLLDFVANHTSLHFAPFVQAQADPANPYRAWFGFDGGYEHGYRTFFNVASMPQLDTDLPVVRAFLIDAARYWLTEYDVDGYRLDYAAGPSHAFWSEFRAACKVVKPDCWLFGEVTHAGDALRHYQGRLDGCLDFAFCRTLRQLCAQPQPALTLAHFANLVQQSKRFFQDDEAQSSAFLLPSFLDNHDMNRFLWVAGNDKQRLRLAAGLLFAFGDAPILYYGTEVGLSQPRSKGPWREEARHPMLWGEAQDQALLAYFKQLIALRRRHPALQRGTLKTHLLDEAQQVWLVERRAGEDVVLVAVNVSRDTQTVALPWLQARDETGASAPPSAPLPPSSVTFFTPS